MARILIAYKQFPAPSVGHAGGQSVFRLLEALRQRDHRLTLVARIADEERESLPEVEALCDHVYTTPHHTALSGPRPWAIARSYAALRRTTQRALDEQHPDVLHVEFAQTAAVLTGVRYPRTSFRAHDVNWFMMAQQAQQAHGLAKVRSQLLEQVFYQIEPRLYRRFDLIAAISEGDRRLLAPRCAPQPVLLLPLSPNLRPDKKVEPAVSSGPNVLFVGAMWRDFNIQAVEWFLDHVWSTVQKTVPAAKFYVVGSRPAPEIRARHDGEHVFVTGFVDELAPWYASATVFVSPMLVAGGLLQKVMDALGMGVPVVATSVSNHGLGATPGKHLAVADEADSFAKATITLLQDAALRETRGAAGQHFVEQHYDPEKTVTRWEQALLRKIKASLTGE
jgi:glycosyltransferase involved in cell wall biosynthesis